MVTHRNVNNGIGRVQVVAPSYHTRLINIRHAPISISVGYPLCGYPHNFLIFMGTRKYLKKIKINI